MKNTMMRLAITALFLGGLVAVNPEIMSLQWNASPEVGITQVSLGNFSPEDLVSPESARTVGAAEHEGKLAAGSVETDVVDIAPQHTRVGQPNVNSIARRSEPKATATDVSPQLTRSVDAEFGLTETVMPRVRLIDIIQGDGVEGRSPNILLAVVASLSETASSAAPRTVISDLSDNELTVAEDSFADEIGEGEHNPNALSIHGDVNGDGIVDFSDFLRFSTNFGKAGGWADGDLNGNGVVDFADFLEIQTSFGNQASTFAL